MDPKIAEIIVKKHPPNDKQRQLCDTLQVPYFLWSIFDSKIDTIKAICFAAWKENKNTYYNLFNNQVRDMNLSFNETFFVWSLEEIIRFQRKHYFVIIHPVSLQNVCIRKIFQLVMHKEKKEIEALLPKWILSRLEDEKLLSQDFTMPYNDRKTARLLPFFEEYQDRITPVSQEVSMREYDGKEIIPFGDNEFKFEYKFFSKVDEYTFSREYAVWFQTSRSMHEMLSKTTLLKVVRFYFARNSLRYNLCVNCMKRRLALLYGVKYGTFERYFYNNGEGPFAIFSYNWCEHCKRAPLFQVLKPEEYKALYAQRPELKGWFPVKVERFI